MRKTLDPGALDARLVLEQAVETPDGQGGVAVSFSALATLWARIEPVAAKAQEAAGAVPVTVTHRIWLRRRDRLDLLVAGGFRPGLQRHQMFLARLGGGRVVGAVDAGDHQEG